MQDYKAAEALLGHWYPSQVTGQEAAALITGMDEPLGRWVGNGGVPKAMEVLMGRGPRT